MTHSFLIFFSFAGNWRRFTEGSIAYNYIIQKWCFEGKLSEIWHFAPWGMVKAIEKIKQYPKNYSSYNVIPLTVQDELGISYLFY